MKPEKSSRIDTGELKAQLFKKVGQERFKKYFYCLNRFINQKVSKSEFDKLCYRVLGKENLQLHNQIIKAIVSNACSAKTPPPSVHEVGPAIKVGSAVGKSSAVVDDGHGQNSVAPVWSNGVVPVSPQKVRSVIRDRKLRDRQSHLDPNGKADCASHELTATDDSGAKTVENGDLTPCDYHRPLQQPRELAVQSEIEDRRKKVIDVSCMVRCKDQGSTALIEDGEEVEQASRLKLSRSPILAPLGIPGFSGARKALPVTHIGDHLGCFDIAALSDSDMLRRRMEQIAAVQGLGGVTMDCANTLNNMLDVYLKRLIRSCLELVGTGSTSDTSTYPAQKQQIHGKPINGFWPSNHVHTQSGGSAVGEQRLQHTVSLLDFKVAMELNPQQLGEHWPLLLEKICVQAFEK